MTLIEAREKTLFGHPIGLFILFFTEMWERFSYYGMRALLVLYLIEAVTSDNPGLGWSSKNASSLYGWYTMLVYITPILGGIIADKLLGFRKAIIIGALLMTLGHLSLAFQPLPAFYLGLILLIVGNGFFKPNISSMVGQLYPDGSDLKDSGYTIFYQGINVGAFLGTLICGYLAETIGWHLGFGVAGIFMFVGMLQFMIAQQILGDIGLPPEDGNLKDNDDLIDSIEQVKEKPLDKVERDRLIVVGVLAFFSIFFWACFEQAGSSMNIFAKEYTNRSLIGASQINTFRIVSLFISSLPVIIVTYLFVTMTRKIGKALPIAMGFMGLTVLLLWGIIVFMLNRQFQDVNPEVPATWFQTLNALFYIHLSKFADPEDKSFDFQKLYDITYIATKNLNKVIDINYYPVPEAKKSNMRHRPIGLGVQGLADAFILLRHPFDSVEAKILNKNIFETIYFAALTASKDLAKEHGPYETYEGSPISQGIFQQDLWGATTTDRWDWEGLRKEVKEHGVRNSLLVAPMPTASTSQILGNNECFEPYTSNIYTRRVLSGEFVIINKHLLKDLNDLGLWSDDMKNAMIANNGSIQSINGIPDDLKQLYKTSWEISGKTLIEMSADRGAFIDQSQSLNAFIEDANYGKLTSMHFYAWEKGLKTGMYYLRTRPAVDAIKFTVDKAKAKLATAVTPTKVEPMATLNEENLKMTGKLSGSTYSPEDQIQCSLDDPDGCEMCGS